MDFGTPQTTNLLLLVLTFVVVAQFALLIGVLIAMRSAMERAKHAVTVVTGGDLHQMHERFMRLLADVERLVGRGNNVLGAVERGAKDLGTAAAVVSTTAQRAMALSSMEVGAVRSAIKTGLRWIINSSPWMNGARTRKLPPISGQSRGLEPAPRTY